MHQHPGGRHVVHVLGVDFEVEHCDRGATAGGDAGDLAEGARFGPEVLADGQ